VHSVTTGSSGLTGASGIVQAASIDTGEPKRDRNLRGPDFFDAAAHPSIHFVSHRIQHRNGSGARIIGELTIKGITRDVELVETGLRCRNGAGGSDSPQRIEVHARGEISRRDFGLAWTEIFAAGGALVSDRVALALEISAARAAA
jgi:polyisoprenoid-binding protein YceI